MDTNVVEAPGFGAQLEAHARVALTTEDRLAAFRLRYAVYIAEQGKPYPEADHEEELLSDKLDAGGDIIAVEVQGAVVGERSLAGTMRPTGQLLS